MLPSSTSQKRQKLKDLLDVTTNIVVVLFAVVAIGVLIKNYFASMGDDTSVAIKKGNVFPEIAGVDYKQAPLTLILALNVDCRYCTRSVPFYNLLAQGRQEKPGQFNIVAAFINKEAELVKTYAEEKQLSVHAIAGVDLNKLGVHLTPTVILVDGAGRVLDSWRGELQADDEREVFDALGLPYKPRARSTSTTANVKKTVDIFDEQKSTLSIRPHGESQNDPAHFVEVFDVNSQEDVYLAYDKFMYKYDAQGMLKIQAVDILKGVVESADDIKETRTRVGVVTSALDLLWKHDEAYARANFIKSAGTLSDRFASDETRRNERSEIRAAIRVLLAAFARHDPQAAARLLDKFQDRLDEVLKGNSISPSERLSLAQASLDSDAVQSAALAVKVLEAGVPGSFPSYLNELEQRDAAAAASLFRVALSILASGRVYNPAHITVLSAYVFRESYMSVPVASGGREGVPLDFGTFASPLSPPSRDVNRTLAASYLAAAGTYLSTEAHGLEQRVDPDAIHVAHSFFLVKKLRGYADRLSLNGGHDWVTLAAEYTMLAERAKLSHQALNGLATMAQRIVAENTVFRFDGGDAAFAAAEKVSDPKERAELRATGIRQMIEEGNHAEAVQKITELRDEKLREQLNTYLSFRMAEASLKKLDWSSFSAQLNRVADGRLRTYLVLSAALAASDARKKKMSSDFLLTAMASFPKIEDPEARAAALITAAGILYSTTDASWSAQVLTEGVNAINRANGYDGGVYFVTLEAAKYKVRLPLSKFDLSHCFEQAAKRDWSTALATAQSIESKVLRSQAYIAACRTVL